MKKQTNRQRQKLLDDVEQKKVWFKLYKAGTKWVIAGLATVAFGMTVSVGQVKADTTESGVSTSLVSDQSTVAPPTEQPTTTDATDVANLNTDETSTTADQLANTTDQTKGESQSSNAGSSQTVQPDNSATAGAVADSQPTVTPPAAISESSSNPTTQPEPNSNTTGSSQAESGPPTVAPQSTTSNSVADSGTAVAAQPVEVPEIPENSVNAPIAPLALAAVAASTVHASDINTAAVDITAMALTDGFAAKKFASPVITTDVSKLEPAITYYFDGKEVIRITNFTINPNQSTSWTPLPNKLSNEILTNKMYQGNYTLTATNTRTVDGQLELTQNSVVTLNFGAKTLTSSGTNKIANDVMIKLATLNGAGAVTSSSNVDLYDPNFKLWEYEIVPITIPGYKNEFTFPTADSSLVFEFQEMMDSNDINTLPLPDGFSLHWGFMQVTPTTISLNPVVTDWQPYNGAGTVSNMIMRGTGTAAGDTITISTVDGTKSLKVVVGNDYNWSANLAGTFNANDALYVVESNNLGDTPGADIAQQENVISRVINYMDSSNKVLATKTTQNVEMTRAVSGNYINNSLSNVTYGAWQINDTFAAVTPSTVAGYLATTQLVPVANADPTKPLTTVNVTYNPVGQYTFTGYTQPVTPIAYPNANDDPTTIDVTGVEIPFYQGYTAQMDGNQLKLKDANNPVGGYIAPVPIDPLKNTAITYSADEQKVTVIGQDVTDESNPVQLFIYEQPGYSGDNINYSPQADISDAISSGYSMIENQFSASGMTYDFDQNINQQYLINFVHTLAPVSSNTSIKPGEPVDPNNPDGPKWPANSQDVSALSKVVTSTIDYVNDEGNIVWPSQTQKLQFETTGTIDLITGELNSDEKWVPVTRDANGEPDTTFDAVVSPSVARYYTLDPVVPEQTGISEKTVDQVTTVIYLTLGSWQTNDPNIKDIRYPFDPNNSGGILPNTAPNYPVIPDVPGMTPVGPDGVPLAPKNPSDVSEGYVPPTPTYLSGNTEINYLADPQQATITYQDVENPDEPSILGDVDQIEGDAGTTSDYRTVDRIKALAAQGYQLQKDDYPTDGVVFDDDYQTVQTFTVNFIHLVVTITPDKPGQPGQPIDPDVADGAKWPAGTDDVSALTKDVTSTITYVFENGDNAAPTVVDHVTFTRTATVDILTGIVTPADTWTVVTKNPDGTEDTAFDAVLSPVINGYFASLKQVPAVTDVTPTTDNLTTEVTYRQLGSWVPTDPSLPAIIYPNDPDNGNGILPLTDPQSPVIAYVPGMTPLGPDGNALIPKNPDDPTQGYIPPVPADLSQPTPITYTANSQRATVTYQDIQIPDKPVAIGIVDVLIGKTGETIDYATADRINELVAQGYQLVADSYPTSAVKFDNVDNEDQAFLVTFVHASASITPEQPGVPGDPIDANNPNGPKWPTGSDDVGTITKSVVETIHYVEESNQLLAEDYVNQIDFATTGRVDLVTGTITPDETGWQVTSKDALGNLDNTFEAVKSPVIVGYYTKTPVIDAVPNIDAKTADIEQTVIYLTLGGWETNDPATPVISYPNDPNNGGQLLPATDPSYPVIPYVPGKTPVGPDGKPLTPKDPDDATLGYLPPTPEDLSKPTPITYTEDPQQATVTYQDVSDENQPVILGEVDRIEGEAGTTAVYTTASRIAELTTRGYQLQDDEYPKDGLVFDNDWRTVQDFVVRFVHATATLTPDAPGKPGEPIDPNNPTGPKWPVGTDDVSGLKKDVTSTITYVVPDTQNGPAQHTDVISFVSTASVDMVSGTVTPNNDWTVTTKNLDGSDDTTFDAVKSPQVVGYFTMTPEVPAVSGITHTSDNISNEVIYEKLGAWTPTDPSLPSVDYPNDPNNAGQLLPTADPNYPVIPYVPGKTPVDADGNALKPKDPADITQGYVPPTPADLGTSTPIDYTLNAQKATVTYQDVEDALQPNTLGKVDVIEGKTGEVMTYTTAERIADLVAQGFVLQNDEYSVSEKTFDQVDNVDQGFVVNFVHGTATITPENPGKPGEPVDSNNPTGPKWPVGSDDVTNLTKMVTETISYEGPQGKVADNHTDQVTFTRTATIDLTTGDVTPAATWTVQTKNADGTPDTTFDAVTSPVIPGYYTTTPVVAAVTDLSADSKNVAVTVTYGQLGSWTTDNPDQPAIAYPNDPNNPGGVLPVTDPSAPVIPYVPGLTPIGPDGEVLQPKDPSDISQGYLPPTPIDPGQSTPINYIANPQLVTVTYQDIEDPNAPVTIGNVDNLVGKTGETSAYGTATRIAELVAKGYVLQEDGYPTAGVVFDAIDDNVQGFIVTFTHGTATLTPETTVTPGTSVDANNPSGPKWPSGVDDKSQVIRNVSETVTYVDVTGQQVAETHHDSVQFTRTVTVDLVNGTVTPATDWTAQNGDTTFAAVNSPLINGFFASKAVIDAVTNLNADSPNVVEEVVYKQLGGWVTGEPGIAPVPYPNDPTNAAGTLNPTDPQLPTIPYVPGKTPVGPEGVALTPKNPVVPADGYLPPAPADLSKDTTITYVDNDNGGATDTGNGTAETPGADGTGTTPGTDQPGMDQSGTDTIGEISPGTGVQQTEPEIDVPGTNGQGEQTPKPVTESAPTTGVNETGSLQPGPSTNKLTIGTPTSSQQKLPQTSEGQSVWATIGLALMSLVVALGLSGKRRKEDE